MPLKETSLTTSRNSDTEALDAGSPWSPTMVLDWINQRRRYVGHDAAGGDILSPTPKGLVLVKASMHSGSFTRIEHERYVTIDLQPGESIPHYPGIRRVELRVDQTRYQGDFFDQEGGCTLRFMPNGELFDLIDSLGHSGPAPKQAIVLDWLDQVRRQVDVLTEEGRSVYTNPPPGLQLVKVRASQKYVPIIDAVGISGERRVMLQVMGSVPGFPSVGTIELILDYSGSSNAFFRIGEEYTMRFTKEGKLFDILNANGEFNAW